MKAKEKLTAWAETFLRNQDVMVKKIVSVERGKDSTDLHVTYNDGEMFCAVVPFVASFAEALKTLEPFKEKKCALFMYHTKDNLELLVREWDIVAGFSRLLKLYAANPDSTADTKWALFPYTHNLFCDRASLRAGLLSISENVQLTGREEIEKEESDSGISKSDKN